MACGAWGPISSGDCVTWRVGRCRLWARSARDEWELAYEHLPEDEPAVDDATGAAGPAAPAPDADTDGCDEPRGWTRYVTVADDKLETVPALPDRPVVVRPAAPIVILPGRWGRFFFRVPLWIRFVSRPGEKSTTMEEIPSRRLASTWFGDIATGELCYAIEAPLERDVADLEVTDAFAACEVSVRNQSRERLRFERICVHVEHMRLFESADRLWTNEVRVAFRGSEQVSQLSFLPRPPGHVGEVEPICDPRVPPEAGLIKRSFALIREIAGMER